MQKHFEQIFCVCSDFHRKQLHQQTFPSSQIETSQKLHNMMDAKDKSLRLASSSSSSSTNFTVDTTATDSSESGSSMTISGDVHTKSSKGMSSEQKNSNSVERKTTSSGKPLNFGVDSILRANTELRSALSNRLNSAFEIVRLVSSKSAGSSKRTTSRSSNASSSSPSSSSSSSSSTSDPLGSRAMMNLDSMSHLTNLTPYEIYAATKAYNDTLHSSATGSNGNATSEPSFGHQQQLQQVPPTVRSAINEQQQPSFSSLYQYYASLNGGNGCGGTLTVAPDSVGSQALHHEQLNLGSSWPTMSAGYEALGTAAAASTASSLNKSLPSPHLALIDSYFLNDHVKANSSGSTLMGPTIESCLSSVYQQYSGGVPYNQSGSSNSFYPSYSTLMNMAGQAGGGGGPQSAMAQHQHQQLLLANSRKLINGGAAHLISLREQQQQQLPAIHKQQSMPISSVNGISPTLAHHHHQHLQQQQQQSQANTSHSHNGSSSSGGSGGGGNSHQHASSKKGKRSWSRAVFSNTQRRGLEKRFLQQKYITKPDRRKLAEWLGLTDAQVKVWFQNRRMKWRRSEAYQALMLASSEHCQHELSSLMAKAEVMQAGNLHARGKGKDFIWASSQQRPAAPEVPPRTSSSSNSGSTGHMTVAAAAYSRAPEMFNPSHTGGIISQAGHAGQSSLLTSNVAANLNHNSSVCSSPGSPSSPRSSLSSCHSGANMSAAVPVPMSSPQLSAVVPVIGGGSNSSNKSSSVLHEQPMQYLLSVK